MAGRRLTMGIGMEVMGMAVEVVGGEVEVGISRFRLIDHRRRRSMISRGQEEGILIDRIRLRRFWIRSSCLRRWGPMGGFPHLPCRSSMDADRLALGRILMGMDMGRWMMGMALLLVAARSEATTKEEGMDRANTMGPEAEGDSMVAAHSNMAELKEGLEEVGRSATVTTRAEVDRAMVKVAKVREDTAEVGLETQMVEVVVVVRLRITVAAMIRGMETGMAGDERNLECKNDKPERERRGEQRRAEQSRFEFVF